MGIYSKKISLPDTTLLPNIAILFIKARKVKDYIFIYKFEKFNILVWSIKVKAKKRKLSVTFAGLDKAKLSFAEQIRNYQTQYYKTPHHKQ